uniref:Serpin family B member 11 (gene/pseudogene) n=1 Tax=Chelonoidis abingdonii TaxID=106734 RepID=A0A8C0G8N6_CHEAB
MGSISQAITEMGLDLYNELNKNTANKNIFVSPMSISTGLVMVLLGARGNTATQMQTVSVNKTLVHASLFLPCLKPSPSRCDLVGGIHTEFQTLLSQLKNLNKSYVLSLANSLFAQKGYNFHQSKSVQMMYQKDRFKIAHIQEMNAQILMIPYAGKSLSMIILLPDDITGLEQKLIRWTSLESMKDREVEVYLPRFKLEDTFELNLPLQEMGMIDVFEESKADLSGMAPPRKLFLSKVVHKAYVEVNEEGTLAAAATGSVVVNRSHISDGLFMADHPFLFFIQHNPTNTILFLGKLCSP